MFAPRWARAGIGCAVALVLLVIALLAAGIPLKFLEPAYWDDLVAGLSQGIGSTPAVTVPYRGVDEWVRIAIMSGGTALVVIAARAG